MTRTISRFTHFHPRTREPMYAPYGELLRDDSTATCHICGRDYVLLASHVWQTHGMTADEYREEFGLKGNQGLMSLGLGRRKSVIGKVQHAAHPEIMANAAELAKTPTARQQRAASYTERLKQGRIRNIAIERGPPAAFFDGSGIARQRELRATDPEWAEAERERSRLPRGGRQDFTCVRCGGVFEGYKSAAPRYCPDCAPLYAREIAGPRLQVQFRQKFNRDPAFRRRIQESAREVGRKQAVGRRKPHPCPACGAIVAKAHPITCSPECRREIRRRTARAVASREGRPTGMRHHWLPSPAAGQGPLRAPLSAG